MKIASWNVNGIRAGIKKGTFFEYLGTNQPDILGLQEVKAKIEQLTLEDISMLQSFGYEIFWNPAQRAGYSGTALLTRLKPLGVYYGINTSGLHLDQIETDEVIEENHEGRVITAEYEYFYFVTVYTPNSKNDLSRLKYREIWDHIFLQYIQFLEQKKPVIFCGDLNVAHKEIDLANPSANKTTQTRPGNAGFTDQERVGMGKYIEAGFIDSYRYFFPKTQGAYTWWSNFSQSREKNIGWRIDYILISPSLLPQLKNATTCPQIMGSDHCPVEIEIDNKII